MDVTVLTTCDIEGAPVRWRPFDDSTRVRLIASFSQMWIVHGLTRSYFTRKVTGYLDYIDRPWRLQPCTPTTHDEAAAEGWTGASPSSPDRPAS